MISNRTTDRQNAIELARKWVAARPVYLDTETTGLKNDDEIIEISIIDDEGGVLLESLVKPKKRIPPDATAVHGLRDEDVQNAHPWPIVWQQVKSVLFGRLVVIYNAEFDLRLMQQSLQRHNLPWKEKINSADMLRLYAAFRAEPDLRRGSYRLHSLANAGVQCGINLPNAHRATADTLLTRALLHYVAGC